MFKIVLFQEKYNVPLLYNGILKPKSMQYYTSLLLSTFFLFTLNGFVDIWHWKLLLFSVLKKFVVRKYIFFYFILPATFELLVANCMLNGIMLTSLNYNALNTNVNKIELPDVFIQI